MKQLSQSVITHFLWISAFLGSPSFAKISFNQQVRPIISKNCMGCHGPDEGDRKGDFHLDTFEGATKANDQGDAGLVPGDIENSLIIQRVITDDKDDLMPPAEHGSPLSEEEIEILKQWVKEGGEYEIHWSLQKPRLPEIPKGHPNPRNEIDEFVAVKLAEKGLKPKKDADPRVLLRRLSLDLTGLPPTLEEADAFAADPSEENYQAAVERYLSSPSYGEHWATMWLDIARYADTVGYSGDEDRDIWPWRDWVIKAFNRNMPYDQFTIEQIAGDLLPNPTEEQILATAFNRNTLNNNEGGTNDEEFRTNAVKDRVSTTVNSWMGMTIRCAECHTHKYDPISHEEYYKFYDFFNQTEDNDQRDDRPTLGLKPVNYEKIQADVAKLQKELDELLAEKAAASAPQTEDEQNQENRRNNNIERLKKKIETPVRVPVMSDLKEARDTHIMLRGSFLQPGEKVSSGVPGAFGSWPEGAPTNRLGVAQWILSAENPLTARVTVNRFWARLFGLGIVETEEDFGIQGSLPSHPELLDWLAIDFRKDWDIKRLLKTLVTSSTYRQSAVADEESLEIDPRNVYFSRGPRFRLKAEVVRDSALAVAGLLSDKMLGPPVYPPNPIKKYVNAFTGGTEWKVSEGEDRYRRAIYTFLKRSSPHPLFETFDMATREVCNMRRIRTNTPLQSFMTLNDEGFVEAAQSLARLMAQSGTAIDDQIGNGLRRVLLRDGSAEQIKTLAQLYQDTLNDYQNDIKASQELSGSAPLPEGLGAPQAAALTVVANVILNLDAFLTK